MAINKAKVLETLNDLFLLEDDYAIVHENAFDDHEKAFKELIRVYETYPMVKYCRGSKLALDTASNLQRENLESLGNTAVPSVNTLEFIKGVPDGSKRKYHSHQWHLASYYKDTAELLEPAFTAIIADIENIKDFEDLFSTTETTKNAVEKDLKKTILNKEYLKKIKRKKETLGYSRTCIYDFSLRAGFRYKENTGDWRLLPAQYVYFHAKPANTFRILKELGLFKNIPKNAKIENIVEYERIKDDFSSGRFDAVEIENFLCVMHKIVCWFDEKYYPKEKK